ncbi:hypothetical protein [Candidatus Nitrotoga sp. AM1P]|uniref:hypothetical protein n=1 Tax=Candidatus Nitrotoga sp. AM1P TaxID=2559597 RepID=UPI0010B2BBA2|nr:hypothetical protein [Candidatus Nitrotoga sp. AM1P]BBJ22617.1 hypothetical protein W01_05440 [Candidatus Nitrotoga sp. AM1P]
MKQDNDVFSQELSLPKKRGRPATGSKTGAERQADSRAKRKALTFDSFSGQQVSWMLSPEAVKSLKILALNCDMSQKEVVERLLCNAYDLALKSAAETI